MTSLPATSPDWLALRAGADAAARSSRLAAHAAALVPDGPLVVHDLGSGTGAMLRWLAPRLQGPQTWVLHDADRGLLARAEQEAPPGVAVRTSVEPLAGLVPAHLADASLVTASALLDVLTLDEVRALVDAVVAVRVPVLLALSVTGTVRLEPAGPLDGALEAAFDDHQRRTRDGRRLLGPDAVTIAAGLLDAAGWRVRTAETPWRLGPADRLLTAVWLEGWLAAAVEQRPGLAGAVDGYRRRRAAELADGVLRVAVDHRDLLAWPA